MYELVYQLEDWWECRQSRVVVADWSSILDSSFDASVAGVGSSPGLDTCVLSNTLPENRAAATLPDSAESF